MIELNSKSGYLNFEQARRSRIFVDKTGLIEEISGYIGSEQKFICITKPRRFVKSMNANMLAAYLTKGYDCTELFNGLAISRKSYW